MPQYPIKIKEWSEQNGYTFDIEKDGKKETHKFIGFVPGDLTKFYTQLIMKSNDVVAPEVAPADTEAGPQVDPGAVDKERDPVGTEVVTEADAEADPTTGTEAGTETVDNSGPHLNPEVASNTLQKLSKEYTENAVTQALKSLAKPKILQNPSSDSDN